jgi:hypothetical protein
VLDGTLRNQLGGKVSLAWAASGLVCEMQVPLKPGSQSTAAASAPEAD